MRNRLSPKVLAGIVIGGIALTAGYFSRDYWLPWFGGSTAETSADQRRKPPVEESSVLKLSPQARKNLGLVTQPLNLDTYTRSIQIPGVIVDRPGVSDRGVTAPAVAVVAKIHAFPGDTVRPGERLFTLRLISEYLQNTQSELFKTTREFQIVKEQFSLLEGLAKTGAVPGNKLIELKGQMKKLEAALQSYTQDLLTRGLNPILIAGIAGGTFVAEIDVVAPPPLEPLPAAFAKEPHLGVAYEVQELKADLGQQVNAGELLCMLANHGSLYIEGHSFRREAPFLEKAFENGWAVRVEFGEDKVAEEGLDRDKPEKDKPAEADQKSWSALKQTFKIRHFANSVNPTSRTLAFYLPLENQMRYYTKEGRIFLVWRFRPGQRVQLFVPVEKMKDVYVLPADAVVREGPEAYLFVQNGNLFHRKPVQVLHEDREFVIVAKDAGFSEGQFVAQNAAASLNRVLKAQAASGVSAGAHVHPDGTVHGAD